MKFSINSKVEIDWVSCEAIKLTQTNEDNERGEKQSTGHHIEHSTCKLQQSFANTEILRLLHKFSESREGGVFHFQNCIEIVCSRWRLPSENRESLRQAQTETENYYTQTNYKLPKPKFNKKNLQHEQAKNLKLIEIGLSI